MGCLRSWSARGRKVSGRDIVPTLVAKRPMPGHVEVLGTTAVYASENCISAEPRAGVVVVSIVDRVAVLLERTDLLARRSLQLLCSHKLDRHHRAGRVSGLGWCGAARFTVFVTPLTVTSNDLSW